MKIYAPVKTATGTWASVRFVNGVGETNDPWLIQWFKDHGYRVEDTSVFATAGMDFESMTPLELREWMSTNGYGAEIGNIRNKEKLLSILRG